MLLVFQDKNKDKDDKAYGVCKYLTFKSRVSKPKGQKTALIKGYAPFDIHSLITPTKGHFIKCRLESIGQGDKTNLFVDEELRPLTIQEYIRLSTMLKQDKIKLNKKTEKFLTFK